MTPSIRAARAAMPAQERGRADHERRSAGTHVRHMWGAYAVLLSTLLLTMLAWRHMVVNVKAQEHARFEETVRATQLAIERRMGSYIDVMLGGRALFAASLDVDRGEWQEYVQAGELTERYPGIHALAYAERIPLEAERAHVARMHGDGLPDYEVWPHKGAGTKQARQGQDRFPIVYVAPYEGSNRHILGYDMGIDHARRDAMERAVATGLPTASGIIHLAGEPSAKGFVIVLPVYRNGDLHSTELERRAALQGFVVSIFRTDELLKGIFGGQVDPKIDFEVFDGSGLTAVNLLHDDDAVQHAGDLTYSSLYAQTTALEVAGRTWTLYFSTRPNFEQSFNGNLPMLILLTGLAISVLLSGITWMLFSSRALAQRMSVDLEAANEELEAFNYSVSHDLQAPLHRIDGFSQALIEDYGDKLDAQGQVYLNRVRSASQRMAILIDGLLDLSRLARVDLGRERVDLSGLAASFGAELRRSRPERRVDFIVAEGVVATGDARLLRLAIENLLRNAWKFTSSRPEALIELSSTQRDGQIVYFVRDNGVGFDMTYADRLFVPFQRLHNDSDFRGNGIGLATVRRIVHRHGGRIWAEGAVDRGAVFYFTLGERRAGA